MMRREGNAAAQPGFDDLFEAHYPELRRYVVRRVEDRGGAEDVLAETFAIAWRRRKQMPEPPLAWLFGICRKVIANNRRSAKRRARLFTRLAGKRIDLGRDPADIHQERSEIARAFAQLSDSQREVLRLVAWEGVVRGRRRGGARVFTGCVSRSPASRPFRAHETSERNRT